MSTFEQLVESRKEWIETVLRPWCREASLSDLKKADAEWGDIAGRVSPDETLWTWAWSRFPDLVCEGLSGIDETHEVRVTLADGQSFVGYPDARAGKKGELVLLCTAGGLDNPSRNVGPFCIDDIRSIERNEPQFC